MLRKQSQSLKSLDEEEDERAGYHDDHHSISRRGMRSNSSTWALRAKATLTWVKHSDRRMYRAQLDIQLMRLVGGARWVALLLFSGSGKVTVPSNDMTEIGSADKLVNKGTGQSCPL